MKDILGTCFAKLFFRFVGKQYTHPYSAILTSHCTNTGAGKRACYKCAVKNVCSTSKGSGASGKTCTAPPALNPGAAPERAGKLPLGSAKAGRGVMGERREWIQPRRGQDRQPWCTRNPSSPPRFESLLRLALVMLLAQNRVAPLHRLRLYPKGRVTPYSMELSSLLLSGL